MATDPASPVAARTARVPTPDPSTATPEPGTGTLGYVGSDGNLWLRFPDGSQELIYAPDNGQVYYPEWSPDGTKIAFTEVKFLDESPMTDFDLAELMSVVVVDVAGNEDLRVPRAVMPHWSPVGRSLAVGAEPEDLGEAINLTPSTVDVATGEIRELVPPSSMLDSPRWSPDGSLLAYATFDGLYVIRPAKGSEARVVLSGESYTRFYLVPSWSTSGVILAFERDRSAGTPPGGIDSYVSLDPESGIVSRVGDGNPYKCGRALFFREHEAHWIPGTTSAAWATGCTAAEMAKTGIWIKDLENGAERFLDMSTVVRSVGLLDVSPDGKRIAFSNASGGLGYTRQALPAQHGILNIYVVGLHGGEPELLVENARFPIWQPLPALQ